MEVGWREDELSSLDSHHQMPGFGNVWVLNKYYLGRTAGPGMSHDYLRLKDSWWLLVLNFQTDLLFPSILFFSGRREGGKCYNVTIISYIRTSTLCDILPSS